ncbi:hypothetical protein WDW37_06915 [Bdellovibrionota bacterium FG-1]
MSDCSLCSYRGYSQQFCKIHRRRLTVIDKTSRQSNQSKKKQALQPCPKQPCAGYPAENSRKILRDTGFVAAMGAALGSGSCLATTALTGGVIAAAVSPLLAGAALAGAGIAAGVKLSHAKKKRRLSIPKPIKKIDSLSSVFGSAKKTRVSNLGSKGKAK